MPGAVSDCWQCHLQRSVAACAGNPTRPGLSVCNSNANMRNTPTSHSSRSLQWAGTAFVSSLRAPARPMNPCCDQSHSPASPNPWRSTLVAVCTQQGCVPLQGVSQHIEGDTHSLGGRQPSDAKRCPAAVPCPPALMSNYHHRFGGVCRCQCVCVSSNWKNSAQHVRRALPQHARTHARSSVQK